MVKELAENSNNLINKKLTLADIKTRKDLATFFDIPIKKFTFILYVKGVESFYTQFEIPKKDGGSRTIYAPDHIIKKWQRKLACELTEYEARIDAKNNRNKTVAHGFKKGKSIITNAKYHKNKKYIVNIDLETFFDQFTFGRVSGYFEKNNDFLFTHEVATTIAHICCYNKCLPQGAPTSPIITNFIFQIVDRRILDLAKKYKLYYTRYADDLTFSTNDKYFPDNYEEFYSNLKSIIEKSSFKINESKTRFIYNTSRQSVTGVIVNEKMNIAREYYKETRAMADRFYRTDEFDINGKNGSIVQLEGRFSFIDNIRNANIVNATNEIDNVRKQYSNLLFYKYFYNNALPLVVTEGPTDILYIKAALKKFHADFPNLIEKTDESFKYKIDFLKKQKRLKTILGINENGADTMSILAKQFNIQKNTAFSYFYSIRKKRPQNPVIFLFDNELVSKDKPLYKFINQTDFAKEEKKSIKNQLKTEKLSFKVYEKSNLYVSTIPLLDNPENEIEGLLEKSEIGNIIIDGKRFDIEEKPSDTVFGKNELSKYLFRHYEDFNFDKFKPVLTELSNIISSYKNENFEN